MAPGGSRAKLHSLSKCCHRPVLPGKGKGDPQLLSAAAPLSCCSTHLLGRTESCPHLPCTLLESPLSSAFASLTEAPSSFLQGPEGLQGQRDVPIRCRQRRGRQRGVKTAEGQQADPKVTGGKGSRPIIMNLGQVHKSNLLISAGVSPTLPSTLQDTHQLKELTAQHKLRVLQNTPNMSLSPGCPLLSSL